MADDENVPMDATAMQAEALIKAAINWIWSVQPDAKMDQFAWRVYDAALEYGDHYKGLSAN